MVINATKKTKQVKETENVLVNFKGQLDGVPGSPNIWLNTISGVSERLF